MQPIAGYNYGARQFDRVFEVTKQTTFCAVAVASTGFIICELFPEIVVRMFTRDEALIDVAVKGLRIVFAVFPIVGFQMVATNFFMSIGKSRMAIFLSLTRQMIFLIPALLILPKLIGTPGVWGSIPLADLTASLVTAFVLFRQFKKFKQKGVI